MLPIATIQTIARARLLDAEILLNNSRPDGSRYLCGYAIELALKALVCTAQGYGGLAETRAEFRAMRMEHLKTHDLTQLLTLSGKEIAIKSTHLTDWSVVSFWNPESRYQAIGATTPADAASFLTSAKTLIAAL